VNKNFFAELKRRHVYKVAVAYAVVAWLLIQIATSTFPVLEIPTWATRLVIVLVLLGFPIALIFAWAFELTPEGIKRTEDVAPGESLPRRTGRKLTVLVTALAVIAAGLLAFQLFQRSAGKATDLEKSIAVLPFQNLSDDKANAYFASGIQEEILTRLAQIGALKVISRTSTKQYESKPGNIREVGQQLGVASLLQGSVQKVGDVVRINVQLIRAATDEHIWAESYNRKLDDIFAVESEVAGAIADALKAKLTGEEQEALAMRPTNNPAAYDAYLRGLHAKNQSFGPENLAAASQAFMEAVKLDPNFALAWAHGSMVDGLLYFQAFDHSAERLAAAQRGAETAMRLAPGSVEAWLAKGYYLYRGKADYAAALTALEEAGKRSPNNPEVLHARAAVERRRGNYEKSNQLMERSLERDPRNVSVMTGLADTLLPMRRTAEARKWYDRALSINPADASIPPLKAQSYVYEGNLDDAGQILDSLPPQFTSATVLAIQLEYRNLRHDWPWLSETLKLILGSPGFELNGWVSWLYPELAWAQRRAGDEAGAQQTFKEGHEKLTALRSRLGDNGYITASLATIQAGLGHCDAAMLEANKSVTAAGEDHFVRALLVGNIATVAALCGRNEEALTTLNRLALEPVSFVHLGKLRYAPEWDSLRADPRFQKLITGAEAPLRRR
jgi:TolB-like protein/Tfp pilus assembly protein PilF